jgi:hypothetical protein
VKLLTSKVTLLNTCEKLKMTHEKQLDLGNIKSKVNETCYCETCVSHRLKCGSGCGTERSGSTERMRNGYGDKMRYNEFSPHFCVSVFLIYVIL